MSESKYRQLVADLAKSGHSKSRPKREISEEIVRRVREALASNEPWALTTVARWHREGADRDYTAAHRALTKTTYVRADGTRVRKTTSYSQPKRSDKTGDVIGYVQGTFWDYAKPAFVAKRLEMSIQGDRIDDVVAAMDQVLDAWVKHPKAKTARVAWESAGHTTTEIDLTEAI